MKTKRWVGPLLAALLVVSFALRVWDASQGLNAGRNFDERFTLKNITMLLKHHELRPRHAFYLSLSYLPQAAVLAASQGLHRATGIEALSIYGPTADGYSPTAYLLCRLVNVTFGVLSLYVVFLIGRRIHSPEVGLLAAAILAAFGRHVLSSVVFKPDILVVLLTTVTFWWTLDAAFRPRLSRYLKAGMGVGLAVATKYTGVASCLPILATALIHGRRDRRQLGWLVLAGLTSVATFVALNPFLGVVFKFIPKLVNGYAAKGRQEDSDHGVVFLRQVEFLVEHHGPVLAAFVGAGVLGLLWRAARPAPEEPREHRLGWILVLSILVGYSLVHAGGMTLFRGQNYLPVVPFSSLAAAWAFVEIGRALARRVPRPAVVAAAVTVALFVLYQQVAIVYARVIPTNWEVASRSLITGLDPLDLRHIAYEKGLGVLQFAGRSTRPLVTRVDRLDRLAPAFLDGTDVEIFPERRLQGPEGSFYKSRVERLAGGQVEIVGSRLFRSRGAPVVVLHHPWTPDTLPPLAVQRPEEEARPLTAALPAELRPGDTVSLILWVPKAAARRGVGALRLDPGGEPVPVFETGRRLRKFYFATPRFQLAGGEVRVRIPSPPGARPNGYGLELTRWTPTAPRAAP
jgi:hypothetical protein